MRVGEAAKQLGVSAATVRKHIKNGTLQASKVQDAHAWPHGWRYDIEAATLESPNGTNLRRRKRQHVSPEQLTVYEVTLPGSGHDAHTTTSSLNTGRKDSSGAARFLGTAALVAAVLVPLAKWVELVREDSEHQRNARGPDSTAKVPDDSWHEFDPISMTWRAIDASSSHWP